MTGLHDLDEYVQSHLVLAALTICARILERGGTFVAKVFRGSQSALLSAQLHCLFGGGVVFAKPASSRNSSLEAFVVCCGFLGDAILPRCLTSTIASKENEDECQEDGKERKSSQDFLIDWLDCFTDVRFIVLASVILI